MSQISCSVAYALALAMEDVMSSSPCPEFEGFEALRQGPLSRTEVERLGRHLAPEHPRAILGWADTAVEVHLKRLEVEQVQEFVEGDRHPPIMPAGSRSPISGSL